MLLSKFRSQLLSLVGPDVGLVVWTGRPGKGLVACGSGRGLGRMNRGGSGRAEPPQPGKDLVACGSGRGFGHVDLVLCGAGRTLERENTWFCGPGRTLERETTWFRGSER